MPADRTRPLLTSATPQDDSGSVAPGADIALTFSEAVKAGSGRIYVTNGATQTYLGADGLLHTRIVNATDTRAIDIGDTSQVTISGNQLTLNLATDLRGATGYSVVMEAGVVTDLAGNTFAGLTDGNRLNFRTADVDRTKPTVVSLTLSDSLLEAGEQATLTLTMSEKVAGITAADFDLVGAWIDGPLTTADGITWTARVVPNTDQASAGSIVFHPEHAVDMAGNRAGSTTTTVAFAVDTRNPLTVRLSEDTGTRDDDFVTATANQDIRISYERSLATGDKVQVSLDGTHYTDATLIAEDGTSAWQLAGVALPGDGGTIAVRVVDAAGAVKASLAQSYTLDTVAPTLVDSAPVAGDVVAGTLPTITLTFSEDVELNAQTTFVLASDKGDWQEFTGEEVGALSYDAATHTLKVTLDDATLDAGAHYRLMTSANLYDEAGNLGWHAEHALLEFETTAAGGIVPATPVLSLHTDSASRSGGPAEAADGITNDRRIDVAGLQAGGSWEYSLDGGESWHYGDGSAILLPDVSARYEAGKIVVRQYDGPDHTGQVSAAGTMAGVTIDVTPPTSAIDYTSFDFLGIGSAISFYGSIVRAGAGDDFVEYTTDSGATWHRAASNGSAVIDIVNANVPRGGAIGVQVSDAAGNLATNISGASSVYIGDAYGGTYTATSGMALFAQRGNDTIGIAGTSFASIDGGRDIDTLRFTAGLDMRLASHTGKLASIEIIDLNTDAGTASTLRLTKDAIVRVTNGAPLTVTGDAADKVLFAEDGWTQGATVGGYATWINDGTTVLVGVAIETA